MTDLLSEVEYGRILGSFTAVAEDFGDTVAPDAVPLTGRVTFVPSKSNISYINSEGETASLYVAPVNAVISQGRIIGKDGKDGVVLLASDSNNVSASVLWNARISLDPIHSGDEAPEVHDFLIEVRRGEVASLIDVIKENSRVHNIALFRDAIAEAAAKFWERVEAGEFRGNQGPPGPAGIGIGVAGPAGRAGKSGRDGAPGVGGNLIPDGTLEEPGFLVTGDMQETSDAVMGDKAVTLSNATSRKIAIEPEKSYVGTVYVKSAEAATVSISQRVFGAEGDIDRVIENSYDIPADTWRKLTFLLDTNVGDQSMEIITQADGRTITVDQYTLSDNSVVKGLQKELTSAKELLEGRLAQLDTELAEVDSERQRLATSLNDLATVLEDGNVDLTELNEDMANLKTDLVAEQTARQEADEAAQLVIDQLDQNIVNAKTEIANNSKVLEELGADLGTSKETIDQAVRNIEELETVTLPNLQKTLEEANTATATALSDLDNKLYGAAGDILAAKANIEQLGRDISAESDARKQLATDVAEDFTERDTRLTDAETVLSTAFPSGPINVEARLAETIHRSVVEYAVNSSETTPPTTGWSTNTPTREPGTFVWFRTLITYGDGTTATSSAALMTGNTGAKGEDGAPGEKGADGTSVKILGTKDSVSSLPATGNSEGDGWLVDGYLHTWTGSSWQNVGLIRGPQGVKGDDGADGQPTFTWIKYADTSTGLGMSDDPAGKRYIGLAFNKTTQTESSTATDYQWALFEGPEGPAGDPGEKGDKGDKGDTGSQGVGVSSITPYFRDVARGAAAPAKPTTITPSGWSVSEPAWAPNRDLYRVEKVTYTTGAFAYTNVTKIAAYAGIDAAMTAANGKNLNTYTEVPSASRPGPAPAANSARTVGDIHRNRDSSTGEIFAEYQWDGTAWKSVSFGDSVLSSLDVGKVTGGTGAFQQFFADKLIADDASVNKLWSDQLVGRTASFNSLTVAPGNIVPDPKGLVKETRDLLGGSPWSWVTSDGGYWERAAVAGATTQYNSYLATPGILAYDSSPVTPGAEYRISYDVWVDGTSSSTANRARAAINYRKTDGTTSFVGDGAGDGDTDATGDAVATGEWVHVERTWVAPDDAVSAGFSFQLVNTGSDATVVRIRNPYVGIKAGAVSIENGAINADKVNAESVAAAVGEFVEAEVGNLKATKGTIGEAVIDKVWADGIVGKVGTFNKLTISSAQNLIPGVVPGSNQGLSGFAWDEDEGALRADGPGAMYSDEPLTLPPGEYVVSADIKASVEGTRTYVGLYGGSDVPYSYRYGISNVLVGTEWQTYSDALSILEGEGGTARVRVLPAYRGDDTATTWYRNVSIRPKVSSVLIEDGAVNASKINAESVAAAVGQFVEVEAGNIVAGSADIDELVAQKIASATASFQKVNAGNIVSSTATMDQAVINQIWADGIAAKALTTNKLVVATGNLIPDGDEMATEEQWGPLIRDTTDKPSSTVASRRWEPGMSGGNSIGNQPFPVTPGQEYSVQMWVKADKPDSRMYVEVRSTTDGAHAGTGTLEEPVVGSTSPYFLMNNRVVPTEWTLFRGTWTPNEGVTSARFGTFYFNHASGTERNATVSIAGISVKPKVGSVLIENGAVSANHISSDSIDTAHLRANAVSAEKILAGAVTTDKMTANSINGDRIAANTLDAGKITANTITATQIKAEAISAAEIASRTITAEKINTGAITANEIKARTITSAEIVAGTITAEEIAGRTITAENIETSTITTNELDVENITASTAIIDGLWVNGLNTKTLSTSRLSVEPGNAFPDPFFQDKAKWNNSDAQILADGPNPLNSFLRITTTSSQVGSYYGGADSGLVSLTPGTTYHIQLDVRISSGGSSLVAMYLRGRDVNGNIKTISSSFTPTSSNGVWATYSSSITIPTTHQFMHTVGLYTRAPYYAGESVDFRNVRLVPKVSSTLIEDGAVTTQTMAANSIDGDRIRAGSLTADKITGGSFEGKTFTGGTFEGGLVVGGVVSTSMYASTTGGVHLSTNYGLRAWNSSGTQTVSIDPKNGDLRMGAGVYLTGSDRNGLVLNPPSKIGTASIYFTRGESMGAADAAIWRPGYTNRPEHLRIRGANGEGIYVLGGLSEFEHSVNVGADFSVGGVSFIGETYMYGYLRYEGAPSSGVSNANLYMNPTNNIIARMTSSRRYKENIRDWGADPEAVLALRPRTWQAITPMEGDDPEAWFVGFVAEEVHDLGLTELVQYDTEGRPDALHYATFSVAQQAVLIKHEEDIKGLISRIKMLEEKL